MISIVVSQIMNFTSASLSLLAEPMICNANRWVFSLVLFISLYVLLLFLHNSA